jgi:hypothetical protein
MTLPLVINILILAASSYGPFGVSADLNIKRTIHALPQGLVVYTLEKYSVERACSCVVYGIRRDHTLVVIRGLRHTISLETDRRWLVCRSKYKLFGLACITRRPETLGPLRLGCQILEVWGGRLGRDVSGAMPVGLLHCH